MRSGAPSRRSTDVAAIGSVGPRIAPSTSAGPQPMCATACATTATAPIVTNTSPTASSPIACAWARRSCVDEPNDAAYTSGGRNTNSTTLGSTRGADVPDAIPTTRPPSTSTIRVMDVDRAGYTRQHGGGKQQSNDQLDPAHLSQRYPSSLRDRRRDAVVSPRPNGEVTEAGRLMAHVQGADQTSRLVTRDLRNARCAPTHSGRPAPRPAHSWRRLTMLGARAICAPRNELGEHATHAWPCFHRLLGIGPSRRSRTGTSGAPDQPWTVRQCSVRGLTRVARAG